VRDLEGQDMREAIQDRINAWFVTNRNPETGEYPDFPDADDGGSKVRFLLQCPLLPCIAQTSALQLWEISIAFAWINQ
jgi:IQ and AAA domain-containing protein